MYREINYHRVKTILQNGSTFYIVSMKGFRLSFYVNLLLYSHVKMSVFIPSVKLCPLRPNYKISLVLNLFWHKNVFLFFIEGCQKLGHFYTIFFPDFKPVLWDLTTRIFLYILSEKEELNKKWELQEYVKDLDTLEE